MAALPLESHNIGGMEFPDPNLERSYTSYVHRFWFQPADKRSYILYQWVFITFVLVRADWSTPSSLFSFMNVSRIDLLNMMMLLIHASLINLLLKSEGRVYERWRNSIVVVLRLMYVFVTAAGLPVWSPESGGFESSRQQVTALHGA